ncbi:MAG: anthranilate phosphoribosyltransferase, partial [Actinomycetota bacterium]|nr:anthranilate phosphoribosyltransferase [Actinomycetota bacterium]
VRAVLSGEVGPHRDIVILNAAAALVVADRAIDLAEGLELAVASIDSGSAAATLENLISVSNRDGLDV